MNECDLGLGERVEDTGRSIKAGFLNFYHLYSLVEIYHLLH